MIRRLSALALAIACSLACAPALAQSFSGAFGQGKVDGELRLYDYGRIYSAPQVPDANSLAGGLLLNARTGNFAGGFSLGASLLSANAFGSQSATPAKVDATLIGPGNSVSAVGQAYLQHQSTAALVRVGDQYLATPWMGASDARVLPASYEAVSAIFQPGTGWTLTAVRSFGWKSRTASDYHFDNNYYPPTWRGDSAYGGIGGLPASARAARGTWALGANYAAGGFKAQGWYYRFLGFARMVYAEGSYTFKTGTGVDPFAAVQIVDQRDGRDNVLVENHVALFGAAGDRVANRTWGAQTGVNLPHGRIELSWNRIEHDAGAVGGGALISPYTAGFASDPLYASSMIRGLVEQGPGSAWKARLVWNLFGDRVLLQPAYAKYTTVLRGESHNVLIDITVKLDDWLQGLSVRNRWERASGGVGLNPGNGSFTYNRLMIAYKF